MASHREAALDRRRGPARPWLGNRPATSSLGGCRGGLILDRCATGATPRGRSIMVSSSVLGHGNAAPWSSPRPSPRPSSICSSGKKKSHPPVLGSPPPKAPSIQTSSMTASRQHRPCQPAKVSMVTLTTAVGRRVDVEQLVTRAEIARRLGLEGPGQIRRLRRSDADFPAPVRRVGPGERGPLIWYWRRLSGGPEGAERGVGLDVADLSGPRRVTRSAAVPRRGQCQWLHSRRASSVTWSWEGGWMSISWWARERSCAASASSGSRSSTTTGAATPASPRRSSGWPKPGAEPTSGTGRISSDGPAARAGCPSRRRSRRRHQPRRNVRVVAEQTAAYDSMATKAWSPQAGQWGRGDSLVRPGCACFRMTSQD